MTYTSYNIAGNKIEVMTHSSRHDNGQECINIHFVISDSCVLDDKNLYVNSTYLTHTYKQISLKW